MLVDNIFFTAFIISITYLFAKFMEMRFVDKDSKPLKVLMRDAILVYFSVVAAHFIMTQLNIHITSSSTNHTTLAFTDNPGF